MTAFYLEMAGAADLLCRIVGLLAQHDVRIIAIASERMSVDRLRLRIDVTGLDPASARIVAAKMLRCIGVEHVETEAIDACSTGNGIACAPAATIVAAR
ncbi:hypothetical protein [Sphingomonas sp.]|uniref:hypothetical protein n=1 Tax=Sphingomonas sp. TaxID=28214 RepID=UPI003B3ABC76